MTEIGAWAEMKCAKIWKRSGQIWRSNRQKNGASRGLKSIVVAASLTQFGFWRFKGTRFLWFPDSMTVFRPAFFRQSFFVRIFSSRYFSSRIFSYANNFVAHFFVQTFFSSTSFFVRSFLRLHIYSSAYFRLITFSLTHYFVCTVIRPYRFSY